MTDLIKDAGPTAAAMLGGTGVDALLSLLVVMIAMITAVFALQSAVTLRADEASGIVEPQLAGALSRSRWVLQRLLIPAVGTAILLLVGGAGIGAGYGSIIGDPGQTSRLAGAALAYWPAVMVLVGAAVALFGWLPRLAIPMTWGVLAAMWFVVIIGDALHLPSWVLDMLPFSATPTQPLEPLTWTPLVVMTVVAAGLTWTGLDRFARRDVQPG
jgi:ABC-2 type transport system permease protein